MTEISFEIEHCDDCEKITIFENGIKATASYYHKGTDDGTLIILTAAEWYGVDLRKLIEDE